MTSIDEALLVKRSVFGLLLLTTLALAGGCSVALKDQALAPAPRVNSGTVAIRSRAEGAESQVGWGRISTMAIPVKAIHIVGDGNEEVMKQVRRALERAGYTVEMVAPQARSERPVLSCRVSEFWFVNYTFPFFLTRTWGDIRLELRLHAPGGNVVWSREFAGSGTTQNFLNGYTIAANKAMKKILNAMVREFSGDDFRRALSGK